MNKKTIKVLTHIKKIEPKTIIRTLVLLISWLNQFLLTKGYQIFPFSGEDVYMMGSTIITFIISINSWWKNNSFSTAAILNEKDLKKLMNK